MLSLGHCRVRTGTRAWLPAPCAAPMAWLGRRRVRCGLCARQGEPRRAGLAIHGGSSPQESSPLAPAIATYEPRDPSSTVLYKVIAEHFETFLASLDDDPMPKACPLMCSANFTTICRVAFSHMAFSAWDVTPASKRSYWPSAVSGGGFAPHVRGGGWPRLRPIWSSA